MEAARILLKLAEREGYVIFKKDGLQTLLLILSEFKQII